jgi:hypothetical protein
MSILAEPDTSINPNLSWCSGNTIPLASRLLLAFRRGVLTDDAAPRIVVLLAQYDTVKGLCH